MEEEWGIDSYVSSLGGIETENVEMKKRMMSNVMMTMEHEIKLKNRGSNSKFARTNKQSKELAHNYNIKECLTMNGTNGEWCLLFVICFHL